MVEDKYYDITLRNVKETMDNLKKKKALITNEILKCGGPNIQREIATLFRKIINTGIISQE
jgi:uncharacterized radical SAM superfamily Fe-S cluster-containing enzyme